MKVDVEAKLDAARYDTVAIYGIGGHVKAKEYARVYNEIDAELFAQITFATQQMVFDFDATDWDNPEKFLPQSTNTASNRNHCFPN